MGFIIYWQTYGCVLWIEYIPEKVLSKIKDKSITYNIFRIQEKDTIMWGFYCTYSPNDYE